MNLPFVQIARDVPGSEGPCFDARGRFFVVAPNRGQVLEVLAGGTLREHANTGGIPAGLQADREGFLWVADMRLGILRVSPEGAVERVVADFEGQPIRGCNDLAFDGRGHLYFTAPAGSNAEKPVGEVFYRRADGAVLRLDAGYAFSNGIAVSADDATLLVAETFTKSLWAFDLASDGAARRKRLFAVLPGEHRGGPDGIDFDAQGNLLAANWGGGAIEVFDPRGTLLERIETPFDKPSNLHFGGPDGRDLYVTEHTTNGVWRTRWRVPGQPTIRGRNDE